VKTSTRTPSGARLPLMLLLGFAVLIAGVVVWLVLTSPEPPSEAGKPSGKPTPAAVAKTPANTAATAKPSAPENIPEKKPAAIPPPVEKSMPKDAAEGMPPKTVTPAAIQPPPESTADTPTQSPLAASPPKQGAPAQGIPAPGTTAITPEPKAPETSATKPIAAQNKPTTPATPNKTARAVAPKKLPPVPRDPALSPSPDPALLQVTTLGPLPRIGPDGRLPRQVYAKPFDVTDKRPRVAIVVTGLGLSAAATESAIQGLPGSVTLAFAPYSARLNEWIRLARAAGHEVLINVPMEPTNYPAYDPGPQTLLTSLNAEGNLDRLLWSLSRGTGYVGVVDFLGSRFTTSRKHMLPVLRAINERGLLYLDSGSSPRSVSAVVAGDVKMAWAMATLTLDQRASRTEIDRKFSELEQRAKRDKRAIGIASPYPVSLERVANWVRQLEARGVAIAPISALAGANTAAKKK
jgi:uncharacterized protein